MSTERRAVVGTILPPIAEVPPALAGHGGTRGHEDQGRIVAGVRRSAALSARARQL